MKFSTRVKVMFLLAAVLVMLAGLLVVRAEAGLPPSPELDAFFDSNAKPGSESPLFSGLVLYHNISGEKINESFNISVYNWNGYKELLAAKAPGDPGEFDPIGRLTNLMNEAKKEYYFDKAHFTFFRIVGKNSEDSDKIARNGADYVLSEGELFVGYDLDKFHKELTTYVFMGGFDENETGFVTFTPIRGSSGGCNAGFGFVGLMLAGLVVLKYRKK